jgi:hypothetical protein
LTLAGSYSVALLYGAAGGTWRLPALPLGTAAYMAVPAAVAALLPLLSFRPLAESLGLSFRPGGWLVLAWLLPPLLALATLPVSLLFPGVQYAGDLSGLFDRLQAAAPAGQPQGLRGLAGAFPLLYLAAGLFFSLLAGPTAQAVFGLGEELGWRGFLPGELAPLGFWGASGLTGLVWGVWHAPVILFGPYYPGHPVAGVGMMTPFCLLIAPLFSPSEADEPGKRCRSRGKLILPDRADPGNGRARPSAGRRSLDRVIRSSRGPRLPTKEEGLPRSRWSPRLPRGAVEEGRWPLH